MSTFWSWFIIVFTVANILACWWLIRWSAKQSPVEATGDTTGHVWDDDLTERNQPLPRWWLILFYLTIVFGLAYLVLYPGFGRFDGLLGWSQYKEYRESVQAAQERYGPLYEKYLATPIPELAANPEAMATGQRIFANNCAVCHGSDGRGAPGFPNLADDSWLYGGDPATIRETILNGRQGNMPALGSALGEEGVETVAAYVFSLNGRRAPPDMVAAGEQRYRQLCVACHGPEGKGNQQLGAPDLTDDAWLHGGSLETIKQTIRQGRKGRMPAHEPIIGEGRAHVAAAYVYGLSAENGDERSEDRP